MPDPRHHHLAVECTDGLVTYVCGCANRLDPGCGALRSVSKCPKHKAEQRDPATLGEAYYTELGLLRDGVPVATRHVEELVEALGYMRAADCPHALEIGCGVSPYVDAIRDAGYLYTGIDASPWASRYMQQHRRAGVLCQDFETAALKSVFGLILAAHCFEHMQDAPAAIAKAAGLLAPDGELWVIVPDDSDPLNADHLWFFSESSLHNCLKAAGLVVDQLAVFQRIERERFLYARARRPA